MYVFLAVCQGCQQESNDVRLLLNLLYSLQARCCRIVRCLVDSARDTNPLSERLKANLLLDTAPAQLADALDASKDKPMLASPVLSALAAYCTLLHGANAPANNLPALPHDAFGASTLETAAQLLAHPAGPRPALAAVEGLPCRVGFADSAVAFLEGLLASGPGTPSHDAAHSSRLAEHLLAMVAGPQGGGTGGAPPPTPLDFSPCGVLAVCRALAALSAARPHDGVLTAEPRVRWLLRLLAPEHTSALIIWPTHFSGNRKGVSRLLEAVCLPLQQPLVNQEVAPNDSVTRRLASSQQVRTLSRLLDACCRRALASWQVRAASACRIAARERMSLPLVYNVTIAIPCKDCLSCFPPHP
jgi:hypothetical protein